MPLAGPSTARARDFALVCAIAILNKKKKKKVGCVLDALGESVPRRQH